MVGVVAYAGDTFVTKEYWVLSDGYSEDFTNGGQITVSYGPYGSYITEDVFDVGWPGTTGTTNQFFKYDSGRLIYYGARYLDVQYNEEWVYIPGTPQEFLPAVLEAGKSYTCGWSREEYKNGAFQGYGSDTYTITVSGPYTMTVPAGTFTTYEFEFVDNWQASTGATGTTTYIYYLAKNIGWVKLVRDDGTYELLNLPMVPPTVTTGSATSVGTDSATLNGTVNPNGASTTITFEYGTTTGYGNRVTATQSPLSGTTGKVVSARITGLSPGKTYHFRVKATNGAGTSRGTDKTFKTSSATLKPTATTDWPTSVTISSATVNARVNPNGESTTCYFEYGTTTDYGSSTTSIDAGSGSSELSANSDISGLDQDITYHYRVTATNSEGTSYGVDRTFTTTVIYVEPSGSCGGNSPCHPTIQDAIDEAGSGGVIRIAKESYDEDITLGSSGNVTIEGGWDSSFATRSFTAGSSTSTAIIGTMTITSEIEGTLFVDNLVIETESVQLPPKVSTGSATSVTSTSATLNGTVNPNGASTTYYFQYGTTTSYGSNTSSTSAGSGSSGVSASASVSGLSSNTTYHYRLVASNSAGTSYGGDRTFTTIGSGTYTNSLGQTFKLIPAGTFTMGSPPNEPGRINNETQHQVTLTKSFYMQTTEVTQSQWQAVMGSNPSYFSGCSTCPVEKVSWDDVQSYINKMNLRGEGTYSLPTEAQWEYAARAGSTTAFANGGITEAGCGHDPNLDAMGWYCGNSGKKAHPVAQKTPNAWGLYDMSGNVYEWCQDWYGNYPSSSVTDPTGPSSGSVRVLRGGSWDIDARYCRSADRDADTPGYRGNNLGFRLARTP